MASMFGALSVLKDSFEILLKIPQLFVPLVSFWILAIGLFAAFFWNSFPIPLVLLFAWLVSLLFLFCTTFLLELIQQIETGKKIEVFAALTESVERDFGSVFLLSFVWPFVWAFSLVFELLFSSFSSKDAGYSQSAVATKLKEQENSLVSVIFSSFFRTGNLISFLILPSIAWEESGFVGSFKRAIVVFKFHFNEFMSNFAFAQVLLLVFLPFLAFLLAGIWTSFPILFWIIFFVILFLAVSSVVYLEQLFSSTLFLWHLNWEKAYSKAKNEGKPLPRLVDVSKPSLLDNIPDLVDMIKEKQVTLEF